MRLLYLSLTLLALWITTDAVKYIKLAAELKSILRCVVDAANKGDAAEFASYHTKDCVLNFQGVEPVPCTEELRLRFNNDSPLAVLEGIDFIKVLSDNRVYSPVSVNSLDSTQKTVIRFRIIIFWLKVDGEWLIDRKFVNYKELPPKDPVQTAIEAQVAALLDGYNRDDVNAILEIYVEDVKALFHGQEQITGKQAVGEAVERDLQNIKTVVIDKTAFFELIDDVTAYTTFDLNHINEQGVIFELFRDDYLWKKVDGEWLIQIQAFNLVDLNCK